MSREEWQAVRSLADDRSIVIKNADKRSCVVVWDINDYLLEDERQLSDTKVYRDNSNTENILSKLSETSNRMFSILKRRGFFTERQMKNFIYKFKKTTNFGKLCLLPKIHKRLHKVPGRLALSICGSPTEKCYEFLDHHLKYIMQKGWSYIKDSDDFINQTKNLSTIPNNAILVTADVVRLYPSIPHEAGLRALREALEKQDKKCIPTEDLVKMAEFVLKNNFFESNSKIKLQVSGTTISTKFAPPYACLFMDKFEISFLETQQLQPSVWFRNIDDIFCIWTQGEEELYIFFEKSS